MGEKIRAREMHLYSEKINSEDVLNFFNQIMKSRIPFLGFIDFSDFLSINVVDIITKRNLNTISMFVKDKRSLTDIALLVFPYKLSDSVVIEKKGGSFFPFPKFFFLMGKRDFLSFALKERVEEIDLKIMKIFGKFIGLGSAIDESGKKCLVICTTPEQFFEVDLEKNPSVYVDVLDPIPKRMSVSSKYPIFEETGITVGVDNFDPFQHTLVVGASGTGKSKALYAMIKAIEAKYGDGVRIVIIDPHGEFIKAFSGYKVVNLIDNYIEPLDVGNANSPLMTQLIAQLLSSAIGVDNKYSERVLFYATHLLSAIDKMSLKNISLLLTDSSKRAEFVSITDNDEVKRFFDEEFNDIYIHHFNDAVLPILNFVGEYELYLGKSKKRENLLDLVKNNRITVISFNPNFFGKRMINFLAGAVINQMYILAITEKLTLPTILVADEFQRVETRVVKDILAETRKFQLYAYLSAQYLGQISKEVHDSIISNVRNIVAFKATRQDATMLSSIMEIKIEESFKKLRSQTELEESKKEMFVRLHQRECIVRLFDGMKYILPMKLHVVDVVSKWGYKEVAVEWPKAPPPAGKVPAAAEPDAPLEAQEEAANEAEPEPALAEEMEPIEAEEPAEDEKTGAAEEEEEPSESRKSVKKAIEKAKAAVKAAKESGSKSAKKEEKPASKKSAASEWADLKMEDDEPRKHKGKRKD